MKIKLSNSDQILLKEQGIFIDTTKKYSEDEALNILNSVYDIETSFANSDKKSALRFASIYARIADRLYHQI